MTVPFSPPSLLLTGIAAIALLTASSSAWPADHREAPLISNVSLGDVYRCPALLSLPMRVKVTVPAVVLRQANISVDHHTRRSDGSVDASDFLIWNQNMGTTLTTIVNP